MAHVKTPLALVIFKRIETLQRVVEELNKHTIEELFIIADGPRNLKEEKEILAARGLAEKIKALKVTKVYSQKNLGLKNNLTSGVTKAFQHTEQLIILEDDCLPSSDFFLSCDALAVEIAQNDELAGFCGSSFLPEVDRKGLWRSDKFNVWGWMTSKNTWSDFMQSGFLDFNSQELLQHSTALAPLPFLARWEMRRIMKRLDDLDTWDVQFETFCLENNRAFLKSKKNLVTNIGFGAGATHTSELGKSLSRKIYSGGAVSGPIPEKSSRLLDFVEHTWKFTLLFIEFLIKSVSKRFR